MAEQTIPCGQAPQVVIRAENNLSIRGGDPGEILAIVEDLRNLSAVESDGEININCECDCTLRIPTDANVVIDRVDGSVVINDFLGGLRIDIVHGNLTMNRVGDVECKSIDGNCRVANGGKLLVQGVGGNLSGSALSGQLCALGVGGNIKMAAVSSAQTLKAGGNIRIGLLEINNEIHIAAGGNVRLYLPPKAGYVLYAACGSQKITLRSGEETQRILGRASDMKVGEGGPRLKIAAGGSISLLDSEYKEGDNEEINVDFEMNMMNERIQKRIEEKIRRAEKRTEAAQRRAEERIQESMRNVGRSGPGRSVTIGGFTEQRAGAAQKKADAAGESGRVTDAERLIILNMLSEKKITAEEAERLFKALEGKFHNP